MSESLKNLLKASALGLSMAFVVGCASTADEDGSAMVQDAQAKAQEALAVANEARDMALDAESTAKDANAKADRNARRINELDQKIDRMFERSMAK